MAAERDIIEQLQRYLDGRLEPREEGRLKEELAADPELARMLSLVQAMRQSPKEDSALQTAARGLIGKFINDLRRRKDSVRRGLLTFDSGLLPLPAGIRPATLDSRRLRYATEDIQLEVSVYPASAGTFEVIGQAEGYEPGVELAVVLRRGRSVLRERSNRFQVFHFARVPEGVYELTVTDPAGAWFEFVLEL